MKPYQGRIFISVAAVLVFTLTQLAIPLIIRYAIDNGMMAGRLDRSVLAWAVGAFAVDDPRQLRRQLCAGKRRRQGGRERAVRPAPRHVRPPAAGVAELHGQDRGRPADVAPAGRRQLDAGVPRNVGDVGRRHRAAVRHRRRAAVAGFPARPADAVDHAGAVHRAPVLAAARQGRLHGRARDQLHRQRRAGRGHPWRSHGAEPRAPAREFRPLRREGAGQSQGRT